MQMGRSFIQVEARVQVFKISSKWDWIFFSSASNWGSTEISSASNWGSTEIVQEMAINSRLAVFGVWSWWYASERIWMRTCRRPGSFHGQFGFSVLILCFGLSFASSSGVWSLLFHSNRGITRPDQNRSIWKIESAHSSEGGWRRR